MKKYRHLIFQVFFYSIIFLPFGKSLVPNQSSQGGAYWVTHFIFHDELLLLLIVPFYLLWISYQFTHRKTIRLLLKIALLGLTFCYTFLCVFPIFGPTPDFSPHIGIILLSLFFPIIILFFLLESNDHKKRKHDDILDQESDD